jgi:mRNA interferase RelE/StbE
MKYTVELKPRAMKDLHRLPKMDLKRVLDSLELLADDLHGDIKRLTNFTPEYRLRVRDYRVLFEIQKGNLIVVYRVQHRRDVYKKRG